MTYLYHLDSYIDFYADTAIYNQENLSPSAQSYKNFLTGKGQSGYRWDTGLSEELSIADNGLKRLGIEIGQDGSNRRLYVIPDNINLLALRNLIGIGDTYIYKTAYYYWNNLRQILKFADLNKPVTFIDLNSLGGDCVSSINFARHQSCEYPIPILDNRNKETENHNFSAREIYNNILEELAKEILKPYHSKLQSYETCQQHLVTGWKKRKLLQSLKLDSPSIVIPCEILQGEKVYYKALPLAKERIEKTILNHIKPALEELRSLSSNPVVINPYECLHLSPRENITVLPFRCLNFPQVWQSRREKYFPLFGQYLEQIEFEVKDENKQSLWLKLFSEDEQENIFYEGDGREKTFIGQIKEKGQNYFKLKSKISRLPIKINGKSYKINGEEQVYKISHTNEIKESESINIRIEFIINVGSTPKLKATNCSDNLEIQSELVTIPKLTFIPLERLKEARDKKLSSEQVEKIESVISLVGELASRSRISNLSIQRDDKIREIYTIIKPIYDKLRKTNKKESDILSNLNNKCYPLLEDLLNNIYLQDIVNLIRDYMSITTIDISTDLRKKISDHMNILFIFIGKLYQFSKVLPLDYFHETSNINSGIKIYKREYYYFLARSSYTEERQIKYFKLFNMKDWTGKFYYYNKHYLWGYGRVLLWYFNYNYDNIKNSISYYQHFQDLCSYLIRHQSSLEKENKTNAFLCLIYLLNFREKDLGFCTLNTKEYRLGQEVINRYTTEKITLRAVSEKKALNQYFQELLEGTMSEAEIGGLLELD